MIKRILLMAFVCLPLLTFAETKEEKYYIYNIVSFEGDFTKEDFKVFYDDGKEVKRLRNDDGNKRRFKTPAAALMYFFSEGWEMYMNGATSDGHTYKGTGSASTSSYWILRKPCTKEQFEKAVNDGIKK